MQAVFTFLLRSSTKKCTFLPVKTSTVCHTEVQEKSCWGAFAEKMQIAEEW